MGESAMGVEAFQGNARLLLANVLYTCVVQYFRRRACILQVVGVCASAAVHKFLLYNRLDLTSDIFYKDYFLLCFWIYGVTEFARGVVEKIYCVSV